MAFLSGVAPNLRRFISQVAEGREWGDIVFTCENLGLFTFGTFPGACNGSIVGFQEICRPYLNSVDYVTKLPDVERMIGHLTIIWSQSQKLLGRVGAPTPTPPAPAGRVNFEGFRLNELSLCNAPAGAKNRASASFFTPI